MSWWLVHDFFLFRNVNNTAPRWFRVDAAAKLVMMAGVPFGTPGSTNVLHVATLTGDELRGYS